jgi:hypothetical protein
MSKLTRTGTQLLKGLLLCLILVSSQGFTHSFFHDHGDSVQELLDCDLCHHSASQAIADTPFLAQFSEAVIAQTEILNSFYDYPAAHNYSARAPPLNLLT